MRLVHPMTSRHVIPMRQLGLSGMSPQSMRLDLLTLLWITILLLVCRCALFSPSLIHLVSQLGVSVLSALVTSPLQSCLEQAEFQNMVSNVARGCFDLHVLTVQANSEHPSLPFAPAELHFRPGFPEL